MQSPARQSLKKLKEYLINKVIISGSRFTIKKLSLFIIYNNKRMSLSVTSLVPVRHNNLAQKISKGTSIMGTSNQVYMFCNKLKIFKV